MTAILGALLLLALAALSACNAALDPIFFTIEREQPIGDAGLPNEVNVYGVVVANGRYVTTAGPLYSRPTDYTQDWTSFPPVTSPAGQLNGAVCLALAEAGGTLYGGFRTAAGAAGLGVWTTPAGSFDPATSTWAKNSTLGNVLVTLIRVANGNVFVATQDGTTYRLFAPGSATELLSFDSPINDVTFFAPAGASPYFAVTGKKLWSSTGAATAFTLVTTNLPPAPASSYGGIFTSAANTMYLSLDNGFVASTTNGTAWSTSPQIKTEDTKKLVGFARFAGLGADVLVGTRMSGYYQIPGGDVAEFSAADRKPNFNISDLFNGAVHDLFYDGTRLFALTSGAGLWSSTDGGATWSRE